MCFYELKWWCWVISSGIHLFNPCSGIWNAKGWEREIWAFGSLPTLYVLYSTKYFPPLKATYRITSAIYRDTSVLHIAAQTPHVLENPNWALQRYLIYHRKPIPLSLVKEIQFFVQQSQLQVVRIQWLYPSGSHAHLNTRWAKCLATKSRAEPALTNFYKLVKHQSTYHLNEMTVISRIPTTSRFIWTPPPPHPKKCSLVESRMDYRKKNSHSSRQL